MAQEYSIPLIIQYAKIAQYLSGNDQAKLSAMTGGPIDSLYPRRLYLVRKAVEFMYTAQPANPTLRQAAEYLFALLGVYFMKAQSILAALAGLPPVIAGPSNQSVSVGANATFSAVITSDSPVTLQWYLNGNPILGATSSTYTVSNSQLSDSGKQFSIRATNATGTTLSVVATLTVTANIVAFAWYGSADPYPALSAGTDALPYQITQNISHNSPITITWPSAAANNQFEVLKVPNSENTKSVWYNTALNNGVLDPTGDSVYRASISFGGYRYYISRVAMSLDGTTLTETYS